MTEPRKNTRSLNPFEVVIFLAVTAIFGNSVYQLLYTQGGFPKPEQLVTKKQALRTIASIAAPDEVQIDLPCTGTKEITRLKSMFKTVQLKGQLCDPEAKSVETNLNGKAVTGTVNAQDHTYQFEAFPAEEMNLEVSFRSPAGKTTQPLTIKKN